MRRLAPRLALLALAWLAVTGHVGACELFRPAVPEQGGGGVIIPTNYNEPDSTLATMARGMAAKADGVDAYIGGIADPIRDGEGFLVLFDPTVVARYVSQPGALPIPSPWDERHFYNAFVQYKNTPYVMTWAPDNNNPNDDIAADSSLIHRAYKISTVLGDGSQLIIAVGYADLAFVHTPGGRWVIRRWADRVDPAFGGANPPNPEQVPLGWRRLTQR